MAKLTKSPAELANEFAGMAGEILEEVCENKFPQSGEQCAELAAKVAEAMRFYEAAAIMFAVEPVSLTECPSCGRQFVPFPAKGNEKW